MCGLAGVLGRNGPEAPGRLAEHAEAMAATLRHRGPDDHGVWADTDASYAVGHTRLSILDLSPTGAQPMISRDGRWVLAFNGEVYNHAALRARLQALGAHLRGGSDTEVLLEAIAAWGPEKALGESNGMFALAAWDRTNRRLLLAVDRMGEKPLYYGRFGGVVLFASELKALRRHPAFPSAIDRTAVARFLRYGFVPAPHAIVAGLRKLPPGSLVQVRPGGEPTQPQPYWSLTTAALRGQAEPWEGTDGEAVDQVAALASEAVGLRMRADVPVGAFLSGGVDSSLVVALMREHTTRPVRTFTIGFTEPAYDESPHAAAIARYLGTEHTEHTLTPGAAQAVVPSLPEIYDEPFADSSQIPTCLLAALTRQHVTVSLSGDGGDELFAGYARHLHYERAARAVQRVPGALRPLAGRALARGGGERWERGLARVRVARGLAPAGRLGERMSRLGDAMAAGSEFTYRHLLTLWPDPLPVVGAGELAEDFPAAPDELRGHGSAELRHADQRLYLPGDILTKVDRATMAVSLEARVPLLDHRLVELAWRLPEPLLVRHGQGKWILRQVLARHLPRELVDRPKMGFGVPIGAWLRGPLRPWAEDLLAEPRLRAQGLLESAPVRAAWLAHRDGRADHTARLWAVLMLQAWLDRWSAR